jgi:transposase-like protein
MVAYMDFPPAHRTKLHSTNPLELLNGEVKRRTDVGGVSKRGGDHPPRRRNPARAER